MIHERSNHGLQSAIKPFTRIIGLWVVWTGSYMIDAEIIQEDLHQLRHEIASLVRQ